MPISKNTQLVLAILSECRDVDDITELKLYKLMYFCETNYFQEHNERLTTTRYLKNTFGPTPCYPPEFFEKLKDFVDVITKEYRYYFLKNGIDVEKVIKDIDYDFIKDEVKRYKYLSAPELSNLSHQDTPFLMAEYKKIIRVENSIYRDEEETDPDELEAERQLFEKTFGKKEKEGAINKINQILQECHQ